MIDYFNENFFRRNKQDITREYAEFVRRTLGIDSPDTSHIEALHDYGRMPLLIKSVPEGTRVPIRCPMFTIENTRPEFYWVTNFVETIMSNYLWQPCTSATIANEYYMLLNSLL